MTVKGRLLDRLTSRAWIQASTLMRPFGRGWWVDAVIVLGLGAALFGLLQVAREWTGIQRPAIEIDLSPWALPGYTFFSLCTWAGCLRHLPSLHARLRLLGRPRSGDAERLLVPLLDILQSIPVLGFMPGLVLALVALFPRSNLGLELAAVIMIFTGQAWNMTFSFYHSLQSVPPDIKEASCVYRFTWWRALQWMELPYATIGPRVEQHDEHGGRLVLPDDQRGLPPGRPRLPPARHRLVHERRRRTRASRCAMTLAVLAMVFMIVALDQLLWRPVVVWAAALPASRKSSAPGRSRSLVPRPDAPFGARPPDPPLAPPTSARHSDPTRRRRTPSGSARPPDGRAASAMLPRSSRSAALGLLSR